jgi:hypothetical protein
VFISLLAWGVVGGVACDSGDDRGSTTGVTSASTTQTAGGSGDDGVATAADVTSADGSGGGSGTAGPPVDGACMSVGDCTLVNDCCTCEARLRDEPAAECLAVCDRPLCDVWGVNELLCSHTCLLLLVECDAAMVTCTDAPPVCEAGFVPSLEERCWSGHCVPSELCRPT